MHQFLIWEIIMDHGSWSMSVSTISSKATFLARVTMFYWSCTTVSVWENSGNEHTRVKSFFPHCSLFLAWSPPKILQCCLQHPWCHFSKTLWSQLYPCHLLLLGCTQKSFSGNELWRLRLHLNPCQLYCHEDILLLHYQKDHSNLLGGMAHCLEWAMFSWWDYSGHSSFQ